jgi:hypothetical protein
MFTDFHYNQLSTTCQAVCTCRCCWFTYNSGSKRENSYYDNDNYKSHFSSCPYSTIYTHARCTILTYFLLCPTTYLYLIVFIVFTIQSEYVCGTSACCCQALSLLTRPIVNKAINFIIIIIIIIIHNLSQISSSYCHHWQYAICVIIFNNSTIDR